MHVLRVLWSGKAKGCSALIAPARVLTMASSSDDDKQTARRAAPSVRARHAQSQSEVAVPRRSSTADNSPVKTLKRATVDLPSPRMGASRRPAPSAADAHSSDSDGFTRRPARASPAKVGPCLPQCTR